MYLSLYIKVPEHAVSETDAVLRRVGQVQQTAVSVRLQPLVSLALVPGVGRGVLVAGRSDVLQRQERVTGCGLILCAQQLLRGAERAEV